jgi:hypothetical protein
MYSDDENDDKISVDKNFLETDYTKKLKVKEL